MGLPIISLFVVILGMAWTIIHRDGRMFHLDLKTKRSIFLYYVLGIPAFYSKFLLAFVIATIPDLAISDNQSPDNDGWHVLLLFLFGMLGLWLFVLPGLYFMGYPWAP
jgi:hypothetical protein